MPSEPASSERPPLRVLHLSGTAKAMGEAFGEICRKEIQQLYRLRVDNALAQARQGGRMLEEGVLLEVSRRCLSVTESYHPDGYAELMGIARAAHLSIEQAFAMNGLTDLRDVLTYWSALPGAVAGATGIPSAGPSGEGCTSFVLMGDRTADGRILCGQSWDLATDNMPYVIAVHRQPKEGPETWSWTTTGCLSLIGLNAEGVAVGTTNLSSKDSRPGLCYLTLIHKALTQRTIEDGIRCILTPHRAGAHYYWIVSAKERRATTIECTATQHARTDVERGYYVHCNHILGENIRPLEAAPPKPSDSTLCRMSRLSELLARENAATDATMRSLLADHENGELAICRHDHSGTSSNGAVVMTPEVPRFLACQGQPCAATWIDLLTS